MDSAGDDSARREALLATVERWMSEPRTPGAPVELIIEEAAALVGILLTHGPFSWHATERYLRHIYDSLHQHRSDYDAMRMLGDIAAGDSVVGSDPRCGSNRGYDAHKARGEEPCMACRRARADYSRAAYAAKAASEGRTVAATGPRTAPTRCGTNNGYARHLRRHEVPCDDCLRAHREYSRERRLARKAAAASQPEDSDTGTSAR